MRKNIIHILLENSDKLQKIPALLVALILVLMSGLIYLVWGQSSAAAGLMLATCFINWALLWMLPRAGRSYGPDRPSALALAVVTALLMMVMGVLSLPIWIALVVNLLLIGLAFYSTWIEPFRLHVTRQTYTFPQWKRTGRPVRLLHIGDIHIERITQREKRLNHLIRQLAPDVIVFSGDFVNVSYTFDPLTKQHIREVIGDWSAPLGVYCVPGTYTVEPLERVREFVEGLANLRLLEDEWVQVDTPAGCLNILGMVTTHFMAQDRQTIREMAGKVPSEGMKMVFTHAPDVAPEADECGYQLYLCGHTHGGQIRFPLIGPIFSASALGMEFVMGRRDLNSVTVYTTRGVGLEGMGAPRARFLCPPEIILWEIDGAS